METLEQAATSGPGLAAGAFLIAAGLTAFGLRGRSRSLGAAGSFAIAAVLAVVAVTMVQPDSHPGPAQLEPVQNAAAARGSDGTDAIRAAPVVAVLEARHRIGGRLVSAPVGGHSVDLGAAFIRECLLCVH